MNNETNEKLSSNVNTEISSNVEQKKEVQQISEKERLYGEIIDDIFEKWDRFNLNYATIGWSDGTRIMDEDLFIDTFINYGYPIEVILGVMDCVNECYEDGMIMKDDRYSKIYNDVNPFKDEYTDGLLEDYRKECRKEHYEELKKEFEAK